MNNSKIKLIKSEKILLNEYKVNSINKTYNKLYNRESFITLDKEDLDNIANFYSYLCLLGAKEMLSEEAKLVAYEEMKNYVGDYNYSKEVKDVYLNAYKELLSYYKSTNIDEKEEDQSIKLA